MGLELQHRWEHALVAAVVEAAKKSCPNCYLGRTAIQKLIYFLQVHGVPMRYKFRIYHYGPFCDDIMSDLDWLQGDDVICDISTESRYSNFKTGSSWDELRSKYEGKLAEHQETIDHVVDALGDLEPEALELIATLDFCFRWIRAQGGQGPWKAATIDKFKKIKKDKFPDDEIDGWYDTLVEAELIEN
jgi:uncharacterized protein YwgA